MLCLDGMWLNILRIFYCYSQIFQILEMIANGITSSFCILQAFCYLTHLTVLNISRMLELNLIQNGKLA